MYYCLISSLAELSLASDVTRIDFASVRSDIADELTPRDGRAVGLLYAYYDIENLFSALSNSDLPHNELGNLTRDQIKTEIEAKGHDDEPFVSLLPSSVRRSLDLYQGRVELDQDVEPLTDDMERALLADFYRQCDVSDTEFLRRWSDVDRNIRNMVAGEEFAVGVLDEDPKENFWYAGLKETLAVDDFVEREHRMDALRWSVVEELTSGHYFDIDALLGYIVRLNILQRWAYLNKDFGRTRFEKIVKNFTDKITI